MTEVIKNSINLYEGDCLEKLKLIKDGSIDMILTDPPYGTTACKWDSVIDFSLMWKELKRVIKPNGAIVLFGSEPFSSALRMSNIKQYKYDWIWYKSMPSGVATSKFMPMKYHEIISIFIKSGKPTFNRQLVERSLAGKQRLKASGKILRGSNSNSEHIDVSKLSGTYTEYSKTKVNPKSILEFKSVPNNNGKKLHPTQKPVALLEYLIKTYTNENQTVLDFTIGSGSTCIAAMNTKRNCIGIELDNNYFNVASKRIEDHNETLENKYTITKHIKE